VHSSCSTVRGLTIPVTQYKYSRHCREVRRRIWIRKSFQKALQIDKNQKCWSERLVGGSRKQDTESFVDQPIIVTAISAQEISTLHTSSSHNAEVFSRHLTAACRTCKVHNDQGPRKKQMYTFLKRTVGKRECARKRKMLGLTTLPSCSRRGRTLSTTTRHTR